MGRIFGHGGVGGSEGLLHRKTDYSGGFSRNLFSNPNGLAEFYKAIGFKHRDW